MKPTSHLTNRRLRLLLLLILGVGLCLPLQAQLNPDIDRDTTRWFNQTHNLGDVTVTTSRHKYSRKNNPAVELMRRVIEHRRLNGIDQRPYYRYQRYQKLTLALNDIKPSALQDDGLLHAEWIRNQVELCPYNQKLILPLSVDETVADELYRRSPRTRRTVVKGQRQSGVGDLFQTGDILSVVAKDFFTDVNIYDDQIRILQHPMTSPIGRAAINFYRYYIQDTLYLGRDRCIRLSYLPNNKLDFGFRGDLYVLDDSSYQVKRCELTIPQQSSVNWIESFRIVQEFTQMADSSWVLTTDDMVAELSLASFVQQAIVMRTTRLSDYDFAPLDDSHFRGSKTIVREPGAARRDDAFWSQHRQVSLTQSEASMDGFIDRMTKIKGFKYLMIGLKALFENFVETGKPSLVDIGPINTIVSTNFVDGLRTRLSAQTTANLHPHLFLSGYYARGWRSHRNYYKAELTYSLNEKDYLPREFPKRNLTFTATSDVMSPSDKFLSTDKDNVFTALKWTSVRQMMFYQRQQLTFEYEHDFGLSTLLSLKTEKNEPAGDMQFEAFRTTELRMQLQFIPGATYINTKQRRRVVNHDAPIITLSHSLGLKGPLGGDYRYNYTEASFYKRFWFASWGKLDFLVKGGVQWNQVPYPLLIMPQTNLSYIVQRNTFESINNMEFPTDRFVSLHADWDLNGKLFNRIPLLRQLKWREFVAVRCLWGALSDKNNPLLPQNAQNAMLMPLPEGSFVMDPHRPYVEVAVGIHNIFRLLHIQYVRRLSYLDLPTAHKHGFRLKLNLQF